MENEGKISVIVPIYNTDKYLSQCIESILSQTYRNFEIILIDDNSTDNSAIICDDYAKQDKRIKVIHNENDCVGGVSYNRNLGLKVSTGDFICFVDSDDFIDKELFNVAIECINNYDLDAFIYNFKTFNEIKEINKLKSNKDCKKFFYNDESAIKELLIGEKFRGMVCNKICKKSLFDGIEFPVGRRYGEDLYVTYRILAKSNKSAFYDKKFYFYRMHSESAMHIRKNKEIYDRIIAYEELVEFIEKNYCNLKELAYAAYYTAIIDTTNMLFNSEDIKTIKYVTKKASQSVKKHLFRIINSKSIKNTVKLYMIAYSISGKLYWRIINLIHNKKRNDYFEIIS